LNLGTIFFLIQVYFLSVIFALGLAAYNKKSGKAARLLSKVKK
jgi:hypothetical protein